MYVAPTNPDNTDTDTDTDTTTDEDDWATQTTAHATALLAAIYALAFWKDGETGQDDTC